MIIVQGGYRLFATSLPCAAGNRLSLARGAVQLQEPRYRDDDDNDDDDGDDDGGVGAPDIYPAGVSTRRDGSAGEPWSSSAMLRNERSHPPLLSHSLRNLGRSGAARTKMNADHGH